MSSPIKRPESQRSPTAILIPPSSPRIPLSSSASAPKLTPTSVANRRIGIAVDFSEESASTIQWAVQNYLRAGDTVILLHIQPTTVLYGADWGAIDLSLHEQDVVADSEINQQKLQDDFDTLTSKKANDLAQILVECEIPFKIHIVKDHDLKERLCLEVERLGLSTMIMGSRGFGTARRNAKGRLGSMSDYCVRHCVCPVVVVRFPGENDSGNPEHSNKSGGFKDDNKKKSVELSCPVLKEEDEQEYHDALEKQ